MIKYFILTASLLMIVSASMADESSVTGDANLQINSSGMIINTSAFADTEANMGTVDVSAQSVVTGNTTSETYATIAIVNSALGASSSANCTSVNVENSSSLTGNVTTKAGGGAILNLSTGINSYANLGSVVIE